MSPFGVVPTAHKQHTSSHTCVRRTVANCIHAAIATFRARRCHVLFIFVVWFLLLVFINDDPMDATSTMCGFVDNKEEEEEDENEEEDA